MRDSHAKLVNNEARHTMTMQEKLYATMKI